MTISAREKKLLILLLALTGVLIIYYGLINPLLTFQNDTNNSAESAIERISKLDDIYRQYKDIRDKKSNIERRLKDTSGVSALVEENAAKTGILNNKVYNRDREMNLQNKIKKIITEVKFEGIGIKPALEFIHSMENSNKLIRVSSLQINQAVKERGNYDVTISFENFVTSAGTNQ